MIHRLLCLLGKHEMKSRWKQRMLCTGQMYNYVHAECVHCGRKGIATDQES